MPGKSRKSKRTTSPLPAYIVLAEKIQTGQIEQRAGCFLLQIHHGKGLPSNSAGRGRNLSRVVSLHLYFPLNGLYTNPFASDDKIHIFGWGISDSLIIQNTFVAYPTIKVYFAKIA